MKKIDSIKCARIQNRPTLLQAIARGEKAVEDGRILTHAQARKRLARWLKPAHRNLPER